MGENDLSLSTALGEDSSELSEEVFTGDTTQMDSLAGFTDEGTQDYSSLAVDSVAGGENSNNVMDESVLVAWLRKEHPDILDNFQQQFEDLKYSIVTEENSPTITTANAT